MQKQGYHHQSNTLHAPYSICLKFSSIFFFHVSVFKLLSLLSSPTVNPHIAVFGLGDGCWLSWMAAAGGRTIRQTQGALVFPARSDKLSSKGHQQECHRSGHSFVPTPNSNCPVQFPVLVQLFLQILFVTKDSFKIPELQILWPCYIETNKTYVSKLSWLTVALVIIFEWTCFYKGFNACKIYYYFIKHWKLPSSLHTQ